MKKKRETKGHRVKILRRVTALLLAVLLILTSVFLYAPASADAAGNGAATEAEDIAGTAETEEGAAVAAPAEEEAEPAAAENDGDTAPENEIPADAEGDGDAAEDTGSAGTDGTADAAAYEEADPGTQKSAEITAAEQQSAAQREAEPAAENAGAADASADLAGEGETTALDITSYITGTTLRYVTTTGSGSSQTEQTIEVTNSTVIPAGVRNFEVNIQYSGINAVELRDTYGKQVYYEAPDFFKNVSVVSGTAMSGTTVIGTVTANENRVVVTFNDDFFDGINNNATVTDAHIEFRATANEDKITENPVTVHIGNVDYSLTFEEKEIAYSGELNVTKTTPTYIADEDDPASVGYLEYTVTVSTGDDAMPEVRVEDSITAGGQFVSAWLLGGEEISSDETDPTTVPGENHGTAYISGGSPGKLIWTIGSMAAHETLSLTYRVKLNDSYVGIADSYYNANGNKTGKKVITNTAVPYSKTYPHDATTSTYEPTVSANVTKTAGAITDDVQNGKITIPFTIKIQASSDNPWPIRNVKIADNFYNSYTGSNAASDRAAILAACHNGQDGYGLQDFKVYEVDANGDPTQEFALPTHTNGNPQVHYETGNAYNPRFDIYIGDVPAGKTHILTYNLVLDKSFFTTRSGSWRLQNDATVRTDEGKGNSIGGNASLGAASSTKTVGQQQWDRKIQSDQITAPVTQHPEGKEEKTVPAGSYLYRVVVNETGGWDVSGSIFNDALGTDEAHTETSHMRYRGYLRIDYFEDGVTYETDEDGNPVIPSDDAAVADALAAKNPDKTVYIDIDEKQSFSFKPSDYDFSGEGAFLLTYYAEPFDLGSVTSTSSGNTFSMSGTVGIGGGTFTMSATAVRIHKSVTIEGTSNFAAAKRGWYFDSNEKKLYWVIEASGTTVMQQNLAFRDTTGTNNRAVSLVGVYIGNVSASDGHFTTEFSDFRDFEQNGSAFRTLVSGEDYTFTGSGSNTATLTLSRRQDLAENEKLFIVLTTLPSISSPSKRGVYTAENGLAVQEAGTSSFHENGTASLLIPGTGTDFKEMNRVLTRDADGNWSSLTSGQNANSVLKEGISDAGIYIDWRIKVNWLADLSGTVHVSDTLPEGLEPVYVRYFWIDSGLDNTANAPTMPELSGLGSGFTDIGLKGAIMDNGSNRPTHDAYAYYNAQTREIRFDVGNLKDMYALYYAGQLTGNAETLLKDKYSLEVQIVTRVTDEDALAGQDKSFGNTMTVTDEAGLEVSRDSATAGVSVPSVTKSFANSSVQENGVVPFSITINPRGETLAGGASTLTLVDELLDPLAINLDTVKVVDKDNQDVTSRVIISNSGRNEADTGNVIRFIVPNSMKLTITYTATPRVEAGETYTAANRAYWYGHSGGESSISRGNVSNAVSAGASISQPASIKVVKRDRDNAALVLQGAAFTVTPQVYNEKTGTFSRSGRTASGTTDSDGTATFGNLEYNTVYRIEETGAPRGYGNDNVNKPLYIVIAQATKGKYPDALTAYREHGAIIEYNNTTYTADFYDTKQKVPVHLQKTFVDAAGNTLASTQIPDGTYRFGLYADGSDARKQTLAITISSGTPTYLWTHTVNGQTVDEYVDSPTFLDVGSAGVYTVCELDANGEPIKTSGTNFRVNGRTYEVSWSENGNRVMAADPDGNNTVSLTNRVYPEVTPDTAGPSGRNQTYIWVILAAIGAFAVFMVYERKRRKI